MLAKLGVDISRLNRKCRRALKSIDDLVGEYGVEAVVTSTYEGNHSPRSLHYQNAAVDIRIPDIQNLTKFMVELREELGSDFDVLKERTHIHCEYDPK